MDFKKKLISKTHNSLSFWINIDHATDALNYKNKRNTMTVPSIFIEQLKGSFTVIHLGNHPRIQISPKGYLSHGLSLRSIDTVVTQFPNNTVVSSIQFLLLLISLQS